MMDEQRDEKEVERRSDEALRRALSSPPKPHAPKGERARKPKGKGRKAPSS